MTTSPLDRLSLRERKKLRTRKAIQEHALRLIEAQGYEATTVEQIAEAAEVSPSTFFRYFPTKEDVILTDEFDPVIGDLVRMQPPELDGLETVRRVFRQVLSEAYEAEKETILLRVRVAMEQPSLRARMFDPLDNPTYEMLTTELASRLGRSPDDFELKVFVGALTGLVQTVILRWVSGDGEESLPDLLDQGLDLLGAGFSLR
jgi:AcrR family transcriptional regulator